MARIARVVSLACAFHVTHRGNHRETIFFDDACYRRYLGILRDANSRYGLRVWAYCLMPNHVHLIVVGERRESMARAIGMAHRKYSRWINEARGWTGHLWANRYHSTALDDRHLWVAARYVELNPLRAGIVGRPEDYPWSSAAAHSRGLQDLLLAEQRPFPGRIENWSAWLLEGIHDPAINEIRANTTTGRPSGSVGFARQLEESLGRAVLPRKRGPKPRHPSSSLVAEGGVRDSEETGSTPYPAGGDASDDLSAGESGRR
jgi:putative transposase